MPIYMPTTRRFTSSRFGLETNTQSFASPYIRSVQRVALGGARWMATYSLPAMKREQAAIWQAFFLQLDGGANTFYAHDPDAILPRGAARLSPGTPLVNGASQTGSTLTIDGCPANITGWLLPGDYFGVNNELKMITSPVNTNGSGQATLTFKPAIRYSPADNAVITLETPTCITALVDDQQAMWECDAAGTYQPKTFSAMEVFS
jgi:hypothetical protein